MGKTSKIVLVYGVIKHYFKDRPFSAKELYSYLYKYLTYVQIPQILYQLERLGLIKLAYVVQTSRITRKYYVLVEGCVDDGRDLRESRQGAKND